MSKGFSPIIALFARGREIGFVVMRGGEIWRYGVKTITGKRRGQSFVGRVEKAVGDVLFFALPRSVIVVEQRRYRQSGTLGRVLQKVLKRWHRRGFTVRYVSLEKVKACLCGNEQARQRELVEVVAQRYPLFASLIDGATLSRQKYWEKVLVAVGMGCSARKNNLEPCKLEFLR